MGNLWLRDTLQGLGVLSATTEVTNEISGTGAVMPILYKLENISVSFSVHVFVRL